MSRRAVSLATWSILGALGLGTFLMPDSLPMPATFAVPPATPDQIQLTGIVRDFLSTHDDFDITPSLGHGHYAGNVDAVLGPEGLPAFVGSGGGGGGWGGLGNYAVYVTDHAQIDGGCTVDGDVATSSTAAGAIDISGSTIDGDVMVGPGGDPGAVIDDTGTITGTTGTLSAPMTIPPVVEPTDAVVGASLGGEWFNDGGAPVTIDSNRHYDSLRISSNAVVNIVGKITILVEGNFTTETGGSLIVTPGSSLDLYVKGKTVIKTKSAWSDPTDTRMWVIGSPEVKFETEAAFFGTVIAPDATLLMKTKATLAGAFYGHALEIITDATLGGSPPALPGGGYKVAVQWIDDDGNKIAPHMFDVGVPAGGGGGGGGGPLDDVFLAVSTKLNGDDPGTMFDGFDSSAGAYGGANGGLDMSISSNGTGSEIVSLADVSVTGDVLAGPGADPGEAIKADGCTITGTLGTLDEAVAMPTLDVPTDMGSSEGDITYSGTTVLSADAHGDKVVLTAGSTLEIDGNVRLMCENEFKAEVGSEVILRAGATLELWGEGNIKLYGVRFNADGNPRDAQLYLVNSDTVELDDGAEAWAFAQAPSGTLSMKNASHLYGRFVGDEAAIQGASGFHADLAGVAPPPPATCFTVSDLAGSKGGASSGGITDADTFSEWFDDVPGTNLSIGHVVTLTRDIDGVYNFFSPEFYPIDGRLLGDEADTRNRHFTYAIKADFVHTACADQFIEVEGDDDIWVYIDGQLVTDLGGTQPTVSQYVEVDRLGLTDGETYVLHLLYANRQPASAILSIRTNLELTTDPYLPAIWAAFD